MTTAPPFLQHAGLSHVSLLPWAAVLRRGCPCCLFLTRGRVGVWWGGLIGVPRCWCAVMRRMQCNGCSCSAHLLGPIPSFAAPQLACSHSIFCRTTACLFPFHLLRHTACLFPFHLLPTTTCLVPFHLFSHHISLGTETSCFLLEQQHLPGAFHFSQTC